MQSQVQGQDRPLVVAHRGASAYAPENTLAAFRLAVEQGAEGIELDVHRSRDGALVVCHDPAVERTTDGRGAIAEQDLAALRGYDAGYHFTTDGGATFPFRGRGLRLPTLAEALAAIPAELLVNVELKAAEDEAARTALVETVARFLRARPGEVPRILVSSFDHRIVDAVAAQGVGLRTGYLIPPLAPLDAALAAVRAAGHDALHPHASSLPEAAERTLRAAREAGIDINVWTVDDPEQAQLLAARGVRAIITNRPDALRAALGSTRRS